jgi:transposase-like protein
LGERTWREVLERFDAGGVTVEAFCRREGVCRSSFARWRSRLRVSSGAVTPIKHPSPAQDKAPTAFVDLGALRSAGGSAPAAGFDLRLDPGGGLTLPLMRR